MAMFIIPDIIAASTEGISIAAAPPSRVNAVNTMTSRAGGRESVLVYACSWYQNQMFALHVRQLTNKVTENNHDSKSHSFLS